MHSGCVYAVWQSTKQQYKMNVAMRFEINWKTVATEIPRTERDTNDIYVYVYKSHHV